MKLLFATLLLLAVASAQVLRGVNYGIQRPTGDCTTYDEVLNDFKLMATFAQAVKIYNLGFCNGGQNALQAAQATGLKVFLGMAAGPDSAYQNEKRLVTSLYNSYGFSNVIGITVGSEDLYRNSVSAATIGGQITEVKNILKSLGGSAASVPVTHTDVYYLQPAEITSVSDIIMFNAFSFWEGADINNAANIFISHYNALKQQFPGRQIWVGETGWPYSGATQAAAVPNLANAHKYANDVVCWANANGVPYFYFEAFDEPWKNSQDNGAIEVSFGLFKADRTQHYLPQCGNAPTGNTPSTQAPTPTASSADCTAMFAQTTCRTASEDPSQVDQQAVANARGWLCANYPQYCSDIQAGGKYSSCNSVEQLSNAMSKYYNAFQSQGNSACDFGGVGRVAGSSTPTPTPSSSNTPSTNTPSTQVSQSMPPAATTSNNNGNCQTMFSQTTCRTASEDPSEVDQQAVADARGWLCSTYPQYCSNIVSGGQYSSCNSVEQLSNAMSLYYNDNKATQGDQACNFGGLGRVAGTVANPNNQQAPTPASSTVTPSSPANNNNNAPSQGNCGAGLYSCGQACYSPEQYCCPNGVLTQKQFC